MVPEVLILTTDYFYLYNNWRLCIISITVVSFKPAITHTARHYSCGVWARPSTKIACPLIRLHPALERTILVHIFLMKLHFMDAEVLHVVLITRDICMGYRIICFCSLHSITDEELSGHNEQVWSKNISLQYSISGDLELCGDYIDYPMTIIHSYR